jgi:GxxExxY protein
LDLVVNDTVIVELKAVSAINDLHMAQTLSYLTATQFELVDREFRWLVIIVEKSK